MPIKSAKSFGVKALGQGLGSEEEVDPHFNETVLLLHADGSEGEGNTANLGNPNYKAFRDNSTSTHAIIVNGDAYGNDFSPYYYADGYWSNFLNGNTPIEIADANNGLDLSGDFTIEFFAFEQAIATTNGTTNMYCTVDTLDRFQFQNNGSNNILSINSSTIFTSTTAPLNQFNHIAIVREGSGSNNISYYLNGTRQAQGTSTYSISASSMMLGGQDRGGTTGHHGFTGFLSNFRIVKSAVYSGTSFTKPTTPLTAIANTSLLTCQSNRFVDNSTNGMTITVDSTKVSTNTPFTQSKTANVGSGFFDGNADVIYLLETGSEFTYGTGDFEFSCWVYRTVGSTQQTLFGRNSTGNTLVPYIYITSGNRLSVYYSSGILSSSVDVPVNAWCYLVTSRVSGTLKLFQDGVEVGSISDANNLIASGKVAIGNQWSGGTTNAFTGYIADARIRKGYGVTSVTVPTTTVTAETGTELLTCQYSGAVRNVGFVDDSKYNNPIVANGGATLGTFSPFSLEDGYWSNFFDASGDYFTIPASADFNFGTGQFTIECFVYYTKAVTSGTIIGQQSFGSVLQLQANGYFQYYDVNTSSYLLTGSVTAPLNTWVHVCVQRDSNNNLDLFINGTRQATTTSTATLGFSSAQNLTIHSWNGNVSPNETYYSNIRIIKGSSVYTSGSSITVPTTFLTAVSGTELLTCQSNRFKDNSTTDRSITVSGDPKVMPFSPVAPSRSYSKDAVGGSVFFDQGKIAFDPRAFDKIRDGDFTIEFWWYPVGGLTGFPGLFSMGVGGGYGNIINIGVIGNYALQGGLVSGYSADYTTPNNSYLDFQWHHIVITRSGQGSNNCAFYINGVRTNLFTETGDIGTGATVAYLGSQWYAGNRYAGGYYSSFRATNNAVYDITSATLTVPSAPLSDTANTLALTKFDNAGIIDHTMKNNLETEDNTRISGQQVKFGTGSILFDGANDEIKMANSPMQQPRTGEFTIEFFVYFNATQNHGFFGNGTSGYYAQIFGSNFQFVQGNSASINVAWSYSTGQFYHVALTRDSSKNTRLFIDGTQLGSTTTNDTRDYYNQTVALSVGDIGGGYGRRLNGFIDEFRITMYNRYPSNFTISSKSFPNK